eukprot:371779_1
MKVVLFFLAAFILSAGDCLLLDIHLKLTPDGDDGDGDGDGACTDSGDTDCGCGCGCLYDTALACNALLHKYSSTELISFNNSNSNDNSSILPKSDPHITLFLTDFDVFLEEDEEELHEHEHEHDQDQDQDSLLARMMTRGGGAEDVNTNINKNKSETNPRRNTGEIEKNNNLHKSSSLHTLIRDLQMTLNQAKAQHSTIMSPFVASLSPVNTSIVNGPYAMYNVLNEDGLYTVNDDTTTNTTTTNNPHQHPHPSHMQLLSDIIANSTLVQSHVIPNQPVPQWVYDLPKSDPSRAVKIQNVRRYGSPNVLSEFEPHLTVGYDEDVRNGKSDDRRHILDSILSLHSTGEIAITDGNTNTNDNNTNMILNPNEDWLARARSCKCKGSVRKQTIREIGIGLVGDHGTVLRDLAVISLVDGDDDDTDDDTDDDDNDGGKIYLFDENLDSSISVDTE